MKLLQPTPQVCRPPFVPSGREGHISCCPTFLDETPWPPQGREGTRKDVELSKPSAAGRPEMRTAELDCAAELPQTRDEGEFLAGNADFAHQQMQPQFQAHFQPQCQPQYQQQQNSLSGGTIQIPIQPIGGRVGTIQILLQQQLI